ncbi:MAG: phosphoglucosamine mutase [Thermoguttaceae bacterium]
MQEPIISVSGLRGVIGTTLTPEVAMKYASAFSKTMPEGPFVVTRDSRPSGALLADAIHATLNATGRSTFDAGIAATPTTGVLIRQYHAAGGIQISASHNPSPFNGMKLFSGEGRVIPKGPGQKVLEFYRTSICNDTQTCGAKWVPFDKIGTRNSCADPISEHLRLVLRTVDVAAISNRRFRVLLDSNHGAGAILGRILLEQLGCDVTILGELPNGHFAHTPEPTPENLDEVCQAVRDLNIDIAFCQDPDADRLAIIDETGRYIGEECTIALCFSHVLEIATSQISHPFRRKLGPLVINCATSSMTDSIARNYGIPVFRSAVGEANVVDKMLAESAMFGGEGNGGPIDPEVGFVRDSFVGMAQILDSMTRSQKSIAQLADMLPKYALVKRKADVELTKVPEMLDFVAKSFAHLPCDRLDGLRINHGDSWVLLRGSNTEPIIRIFAEAETEMKANMLCDEVISLMR